MRKNILLLCLLLILVFSGASFFVTTHPNIFPLLYPTGYIAIKERNLIVLAVCIMLAVALPVLGSMFFIAWKYREGNKKAAYTDLSGNNALKVLWWAIPSSLVVIFSFIIWNAAHQLDPYKALDSSAKPITIQVVALQWKWLFIYPDQHIATVNFMEFPVHTPINFELTANAPMNSFWIPALGGQIYAMATMQTQTHLLSDKIGDFSGGAAEINGAGYADMRFTVRVSSQADFNAWVKQIKKSRNPLDTKAYNGLAKPNENTPATYYSTVDNNLYNTIVTKDMQPKVKNDD